MKKALKIIGIIVLVLVLCVVGFITFVAVRGVPSYKAEVPQIAQVASTPERIARGKKIADMLCRNCHFNPATGKFTGRELKEVEEFGKIRSRNITQSKDNGIGSWSDAEIIYLIRTGIHPKTGQYLPPYMPKLQHISDEDLRSVVAYLHSDYPEMQPSAEELPATEPSFLTKFLCNTVFKPFPYPKEEIMNPDTTNQIEWGKYLAVYQIECFTCHSGDFKKMDMMTPEKSYLYFGGGNQLRNENGETITTLNLTPDKETGIGDWTEEQFVRAVRTGIVPNGPALRSPMQPYVQLTENEAKAIYAYLRTVPPISHKIDRGI